ncbi:PH domain-containing protein [Lactobacillus sp. S2-2]|uniref:PH domain-containing protein n=1 Tax=Lactobacillus sp. S2-2 TaxID=2692917 RepID=UPI001F2A0E90|nr:PH domain-containing protein [Lactobacillus sp. S2-2]
MPKRIKKVWLIANLLGALIFIILASLIYRGLTYFKVEYVKPIYLIAVLAIIVIWSIVDIALIPYRYAFHRYEFNDEDLTVQSGFFFRHTTFIPLNRIQHIKTEQGPLLRLQNLTKLSIHTAATTHSIAGLDTNEAIEVRKQLIQLVKVAKEDV